MPSVKCFRTLATLSFDVQKTQRLHQAFSRFIGSHLAVAFESDPEAEIRQLNSRRVELERALSNHENDNQQQRIQFEQAKEGVTALNRILPRLNLLADDSLADRVDEIRERLDEAQEAARLFSSLAINWRNWNRLFGIAERPGTVRTVKRRLRVLSRCSAMPVSRRLP